MAKSDLSSMTQEELHKKEKGLKMLIAFFIPIILLLFFFVLKDFLEGKEMDWSMLTIAICTLAGPITIYPQFQEVRKELSSKRT
ncbi:hypothetical protein [Jiulongibacter sediminis]|nr:hypothetical protein [Jiulongibacter sediminis]